MIEQDEQKAVLWSLLSSQQIISFKFFVLLFTIWFPCAMVGERDFVEQKFSQSFTPEACQSQKESAAVLHSVDTLHANGFKISL